MTEAEIIDKLIEGNEEAFRILIDDHKERIFKVCVGFLHNNDDADDITQDVFIEVFRSIKTFKRNSSLSTWLHKIAVNKSLNFLKKKKSGGFIISIQAALGFKQIPSQRNPHEQLLEKEKKSILNGALQSLPENQRIAFTLAKYDDLSYKEIAEIMELSESSVESLMFRAKGNLQKYLGGYVIGVRSKGRGSAF